MYISFIITPYFENLLQRKYNHILKLLQNQVHLAFNY